MTINPADNTILGLNEPVKWGPSKAPNPAAAPGTDSLDQTFKLHIQKALSIASQTGEVDISQIRRELDAGLYDSPEMVRAAAEKISRLGI